MACNVCGGSTTKVKETKQAKYRGEIVEVVTELFRCDSCKEGFVTPEQMRAHVRTVKNEVRREPFTDTVPQARSESCSG